MMGIMVKLATTETTTACVCLSSRTQGAYMNAFSLARSGNEIVTCILTVSLRATTFYCFLVFLSDVLVMIRLALVR